jgi:hypothetical protein
VIAERPKRRCAARNQPEPRIGASVVRRDSAITRRLQRGQTRFSDDSTRRTAHAARGRAVGALSPPTSYGGLTYLVRWTAPGRSSPSYLVRWTRIQSITSPYT